MVQRVSFDDSTCPVARALDVVGDWWSLLIVRDAFDGMRRFGEFQRSLGVAKNVLTVRLKALVASGVLEVVPAADGSAYSEYVLTPRGRGLFPVIVGLRQWGEDHLFAPGEARSRLVDTANGRPVARLEVLASDGRRLAPGEALVKKPTPATLAAPRRARRSSGAT